MARRFRSRNLGTQGNAPRKTVRMETIVACSAFGRGYREALTGKPFDSEAYAHTTDDVNHPWAYERGRQFAQIYRGPLKNGHKVIREALLAYAEARQSRAIV
jgi:hypothetical protein